MLAFGIAHVTADLADENRLSVIRTANVTAGTGTLSPAALPFHYGLTRHSDDTPGAPFVPRNVHDRIIAGDWRGDGFTRLGTAQVEKGSLYFLLDTDRDSTAEYVFQFGSATDTPVVGNFDGSNGDDIAVVGEVAGSTALEWEITTARAIQAPKTGRTLNLDSYPRDRSPRQAEYKFRFGEKSDQVLAGDFDSDGRDDLVAVRLVDKKLKWHIYLSGGRAYPTDGSTLNGIAFEFGVEKQLPIIGDWNSDGQDDIGLIDTATVPAPTWTFRTLIKGSFRSDTEFQTKFGSFQTGEENVYLVGNWGGNYFHGNKLDGTPPSVSTATWNSEASWSERRIPLPGEVVVIDQPAEVTIDLSGGDFKGSLVTSNSVNITGGTVQLDASSNLEDVTLSGGTLKAMGNFSPKTFSQSGGVLDVLASESLGTAELNISGGTIRSTIPQTQAPNIRLNNKVVFSNTVTIDSKNSSYLVLGGQISGTGELKKTGEGFVYFPFGGGSYTGKATVSEGSLVINDSTQLSEIVVDGGILQLFNAIGLATNVNVASGSLAPDSLFQFNRVAIQSGTHRIEHPFTAREFSQSGGVVTLASRINVDRMIVSGGTLNVGTQLKSQSSLQVTGGEVRVTAPQDLATVIANNGKIQIEHAAAERPFGTAAITMTNATLVSNIDSSVTGGFKNFVIPNAIELNGLNTIGNSDLVESNSRRNYMILSGVISGSGGWRKVGRGSVVVSGANTYQGETIIDLGEIVAESASSLGSTVNGITINALPAGEDQLSLPRLGLVGISSAENITIGSNARMDMRQAARHTGRLTLESGSAVLMENGVELAGNVSMSGTVILQSVEQLQGAQSREPARLSGRLSGNANLTLATDSGLAIELSNPANSYTGQTTLLGAGTIHSAAAQTLGTSSLEVRSGATWSPGGFRHTVASLSGGGNITLNNTSLQIDSGTFAGVISGKGQVNKSSSSTLTLSGLNTFEGLLSIDAGRVVAGAVNVLPLQPVEVALGATLSLGQNSQRVATISGDGTIEATGATLIVQASADSRFNGKLSGGLALTKRSSGTLTLGSTNDHTGETKVEGGALVVAATNGLGSGTLSVESGATVNVQRDQQFSALINSGSVALSGLQSLAGLSNTGTVTGTSAVVRLSGNATNTGTLSLGTLETTGNSGTQQLSLGSGSLNNLTASGAALVQFSTTVPLTMSGTLSLLAGTLDLGPSVVTAAGVLLNGSASTELRGTGSLTSTSAFDLRSGLVAIRLEGDRGLTKRQSTTVTLASTNAISGDVTVEGGTLIAGGSNSLGGAVTTQSGSVLNVQGNQAVASLTNAGTVIGNSSILAVAGNVTNTGTMSLGSLETTGSSGTQQIRLGSGSLNNLTTRGAAQVQLSANSPLSMSGTLSLLAGSLDLGSTAITTTGVLLNGSPNTELRGTGSITSTSAFDLRSGLVSVRLEGTRGLIKSQATTVTLSTSNAISGDVTIEGGTLIASGRNALGGSVATRSGSVLDLQSSQVLVSLIGAGTINANSSTLQLSGSFSSTGTFQAGTSTLHMNGTGEQTVAVGNNRLHHLLVDGTGNRVRLSSSEDTITFTGSMRVTSGDLDAGNFAIRTDSFQLDSSTQSAIRGINKLTSSSTYDIRSGIVAIELAGDIGLRKSSSGRVRLDVPATYRGNTEVLEGSLVANTVNAIGLQSPVTVNSGATLDFGDFSSSLHSITNQGNVLAGQAELTIANDLLNNANAIFQSGQTTLVLNGDLINRGSWPASQATVQWVGQTEQQTLVSGGAVFARMLKPSSSNLVIQDSGSVAGGYVHTGGRLHLAGGTLNVGSLQWNDGNLSTNADANSFGLTVRQSANFQAGQIDAPIAGGDVWSKSGAGELIFSAPIDYAVRLEVQQGSLQVIDSASLPKQRDLRVAEEGQLTLHSGSASFANLEVAGSLDVGRATLTIQPTTQPADMQSPYGIVTGTISGTGGLNKLGPGQLMWSGNNQVSGDYQIDEGWLILASDRALSTNSNLKIAQPAVVQIKSARLSTQELSGEGELELESESQLAASSGKFSGRLQGSGRIIKSDVTQWELAQGTHGNFAGRLDVSSGNLIINGQLPATAVTVASGARLEGRGELGSINLQPGATLSPGNSPGRLKIASLQMEPGAVLMIELHGREAGGSFDQLAVTGHAQLEGNILVRLSDELKDNLNSLDFFDIVTFQSAIGIPQLSIINDGPNFQIEPRVLVGSYRLLIDIPAPNPIITQPGEGRSSGGGGEGPAPKTGETVLVSYIRPTDATAELKFAQPANARIYKPSLSLGPERFDVPVPPSVQSIGEPEVVAAAIDSALAEGVGMGFASISADMKPLTIEQIKGYPYPEFEPLPTLEPFPDWPQPEPAPSNRSRASLLLGSGITTTLLGLGTVWFAYRSLKRKRQEVEVRHSLMTSEPKSQKSSNQLCRPAADSCQVHEESAWTND